MAEMVQQATDGLPLAGNHVRVSFCAPGPPGRSMLAALIAAQATVRLPPPPPLLSQLAVTTTAFPRSHIQPGPGCCEAAGTFPIRFPTERPSVAWSSFFWVSLPGSHRTAQIPPHHVSMCCRKIPSRNVGCCQKSSDRSAGRAFPGGIADGVAAGGDGLGAGLARSIPPFPTTRYLGMVLLGTGFLGAGISLLWGVKGKFRVAPCGESLEVVYFAFNMLFWGGF